MDEQIRRLLAEIFGNTPMQFEEIDLGNGIKAHKVTMPEEKPMTPGKTINELVNDIINRQTGVKPEMLKNEHNEWCGPGCICFPDPDSQKEIQWEDNAREILKSMTTEIGNAVMLDVPSYIVKTIRDLLESAREAVDNGSEKIFEDRIDAVKGILRHIKSFIG